jgi:hypothetical protein
VTAEPTPEPVDATELVDRYWPVDGPHTEDRLASAAEATARLARYLAHATTPGHIDQGLPHAPAGEVVVGQLRQAAASHTQVYRQLAGWADNLAEDPTLRHDQVRDDAGRSAQAAIGEAGKAAFALGHAAAGNRELEWDLVHAQSPLSHLYHQDGPDRGLDR